MILQRGRLVIRQWRHRRFCISLLAMELHYRYTFPVVIKCDKFIPTNNLAICIKSYDCRSTIYVRPLSLTTHLQDEAANRRPPRDFSLLQHFLVIVGCSQSLPSTTLTPLSEKTANCAETIKQ